MCSETPPSPSAASQGDSCVTWARGGAVPHSGPAAVAEGCLCGSGTGFLSSSFAELVFSSLHKGGKEY